MKKRLLSMLLAALMLLTLVPTVAMGEEPKQVSSYADLQTAINNAAGKTEIQLTGDIELSTYPLYVDAGKTIILDLNGKKIDRGLNSPTGNGHVIVVSGTLTVTDNSIEKNGKITGGYDSTSGGVGACTAGAPHAGADRVLASVLIRNT